MSDLGRLKENAYDNVSRTITRIFDVPCDATMDSIVYALGEIQAKLCDSNNRLCAALKLPEGAEKVVKDAQLVMRNTPNLKIAHDKVFAALALIPPALTRVKELEVALLKAEGELIQAEESLGEIRRLMPEVCQLFDGWHADGTAWSEWDESVRKRLANWNIRQEALAALTHAKEAK